jgi:catechol 2,3-dioxygenase-like lactoylglutathione lyase family enzyme
VDPSIDVITLGVTDLNRALEFYEGGFGFPSLQAAGERVSLRLGGDSSTLELCPWDALASEVGVSPQSSGFRGFTLSYIVEQAADVDDMLVRLEHAGGVVSKQPKFAFWGYSAHVTDPSGHLWKIASPKRKSLIARKRAVDGIPNVIPAQELALTIGVADMKRAKQFYKDGLGNPTKKDYSKFVSFEGGDGRPDLAMYTWDALADDAGVPAEGSGFRGFRIGDVVDSAQSADRLLDKAGRAGARILRRALDTPRGDHSGYFADPDDYLWKIASPV